jgi:peroxiredoxin (alkyl hydroperoxide reductase subunit C)
MALQVGDTVPDIALLRMTADGPEPLSADELFRDKKVVIFALPGAFTPTCSAQHLPGFIANAAQITARGIDTIACLAVNDVFVMNAWGEAQGVGDKIMMLADGAGAFSKAAGLDWDLSAHGLGVRSQRYAMIVENGTVSHIAVEEGGAFDVSSAESILAAL